MHHTFIQHAQIYIRIQVIVMIWRRAQVSFHSHLDRTEWLKCLRWILSYIFVVWDCAGLRIGLSTSVGCSISYLCMPLYSTGCRLIATLRITTEESSRNTLHHRDHITLRGYRFLQQHRVTGKIERVSRIQDNRIMDTGWVKTMPIMVATVSVAERMRVKYSMVA